MIVERLLNDC